ncbi:hypothetical protein GCM10010218_17100 [Streptomyces mashuensis]|uniref:Uncharacterized protein n=1 Tax=Streptomyces mashuensis TaxID=33904 RepID=A0A919B0B1_9ACTN|nr:hypothetical protein GCM10010218_17100 [Streptomyces mashuensis]
MRSRKPHPPKPSSVATQATKRTAPTPPQSIERSAARSADGPSTASDRSSSGRTGTVLIQIMKRRASGGAALRVRTLETPQAAAARTTSANPRSGPDVPSSTAATTTPASATAMPASRSRPGRSPSAATANAAVKTACAWSTSEARPAGIPTCMPTNSSPNLATPRASPTPTIHRHRTGGGPAKKTAGTAAARKRRAQKSNGGKCPRPRSMTTKFTPQRAVTSTARAMWCGRMRRASRAATM